MSFVPIKNLLPQSLQKSGTLPHVEVKQMLQYLIEAFKEFTNFAVYVRVKPLYIKNKIITLICFSPAAENVIRLKEKAILDRINTKFEKEVIRGFRYL